MTISIYFLIHSSACTNYFMMSLLFFNIFSMKDLEKLEESKKGALDQLMKETEQMKSAFEEKIKSMKEERDLEYSNVVAKHKEEVAELATCHKEEMNSIKEMLQSQQNEVIRKLEAESKELTDQKLRDIENLEAKLKQYESEISRLKSMVEEEHSKSSFSSDELVSRQKQLDEMQSDLERTKNQLISSQAKVSMLEVCGALNISFYGKKVSQNFADCVSLFLLHIHFRNEQQLNFVKTSSYSC